MIIYNVTIKVEWTIAGEWLQWMHDVYIQQVLSTNCFESHRFVRLLRVDESEGPTYAVQYYTTSLDRYDEYQFHFAAAMNNQMTDVWGNRFVDFGTLMQDVLKTTQ